MANKLQWCLGTVLSERRERSSEKGKGGRMKKREKLQEPTERKEGKEGNGNGAAAYGRARTRCTQ